MPVVTSNQTSSRMIIAKIHVTLKNGILDPQGKTVHHALENLGIVDIAEVRVGKLITLRFDEVTEKEAERLSHTACKKLLANPVIEDYRIELMSDDGAS